METFAKFRTWAFITLFTGLVSLVGYTWNSHVSAETNQNAALVERDKELAAEVKQLRDIVIRLDAYITNQQELNEWFVSESRRRARSVARP